MYGLNLGSVYALTALGYTMVYGIIRMINFAHGDFIMVGGFTLFYTIPVMNSLGLPPWFAVFAAIIVCVFVGVLTEQIAYKPVRGQSSTTALITALGMEPCSGERSPGALRLFSEKRTSHVFPAYDHPVRRQRIRTGRC